MDLQNFSCNFDTKNSRAARFGFEGPAKEVMDKTHAYVPGDEFPYHYKYEHMAITTDCVIFTWEDGMLKVLLIRRGNEPFKGAWAFPGGFLRIHETVQECALRELREETALEPSAIGELGVFSEPDRDPRERVVTIAFYGLVKPFSVLGGDDAERADWFPVSQIPPLAFDHKKIMDAAMERLRIDIHFKPVGFDLLDEEFSIPDLQNLYEAILGHKFDRRNFQRKMLATGILDEVSPEDDPQISLGIYMDNVVLETVEKDTREKGPRIGSGQKSVRPGRTPTRWRLNPENYEKMKEEGWKLEF